MHATKYLTTCDQCRLRKVRCLRRHEQDQSCIQCSKRQQLCNYSPASIRQMKAARKSASQQLSAPNRLLPSTQPADSPAFVHNRTPSFDFDIPASISEASVTPNQPSSDPNDSNLSPTVTRDPQLYVDKFVLNGETDQLRQNENSIYIGTNEHVASSSIAFFSENTIDALCHRLGHDRLKQLVNKLEASGHKHLHASTHTREPQDEIETSLEEQQLYVQSYFEYINPIYPFLDKKTFDDAAFRSPEQYSSDSSTKPWLALYYTVLALGCLYHDGGSFYPGKGLAWRYFRVSFGYFGDLLISKASLLKTQALTAMAIFALNHSSLHLETLCISEAARAVVTMGLHKKMLNPESEMQRRKIFWVVYCLEKEYAFNSTLASLIPDVDISCPLPVSDCAMLEGFDWLQCWARFSRILNRAYNMCFSITATLNSKEDHLAVTSCINQDLDAWKNSIPELYRPESAFRQHRMRFPVVKELAVRIRLIYHNLRICLARLTIHIAHEERSKQRSEAKTNLMQSARSLVELTQYISLEPYSPVWNSGCMPLVAMFILFDFVVHNPRHQETRRNLSYLDIVAAHFSRLEWISNGWICGVTVAEFAAVARQYVDSFMTSNENTSDGLMSGFRQRLGSSPDGNDNRISGMASVAQESADLALNEDVCNQIYISADENYSVVGGFDLLDFPEGNDSLYMALQHSVFDIGDVFGLSVT